MKIPRRYLPLAGMLAAARALRADRANGNPRLEKLYGTFIAPCCWRENLRTHDSPKADEMRAEIQQFIAQGLSDQAISAKYVAKYTRRVLSMPEGQAGQLLQVMPWAAAVAGAAGLGWMVKRSVERQKQVAATPAGPLPEIDEDLLG